MASQDREDPVQELIRQYLPTETLSEARNLVHRFQEGAAFKLYVVRRMWLVIPAGLVILLVSLACAAATVLFLAAGSSWLALPAFLLAPFILIGSLFVQLYVFGASLPASHQAGARGACEVAGEKNGRGHGDISSGALDLGGGRPGRAPGNAGVCSAEGRVAADPPRAPDADSLCAFRSVTRYEC
jgi:hypothetical protein